MKKLIITTVLFVTASFAMADDISLGVPGYGGTGCPAGTVSATLSPDSKELSLLFDSYQVEAGGTSGRVIDRKSCNVAIPVHIPQGMSVSVLSVDYRGYNFLPQNAKSIFNVEYFFAGSRGPSFTKTYMGPIDNNFFIVNPLTVSALVWSPCGADVNLRTNSSLRVESRTAQAIATVDSADVSAAIIYHLQWRACQ
ncbi:MAG: DUF4360 domain-containing protein [Pseudobdellovibrio sp.]